MNTKWNISPGIDISKAKELVKKPLVVPCRGPFNDKLVEDVTKAFREAVETGQPVIPIEIDSYGGEVYSLMALLDLFDNSPVPVATIVVGKAMSCGAVLFAAGARRFITPSATVMVHQVSSMQWGKLVDLKNDLVECSRLNEVLLGRLDSACGKAPGYWDSAIAANNHSDIFLNAQQTRECGLATGIGRPSWAVDVTATVRLA